MRWTNSATWMVALIVVSQVAAQAQDKAYPTLGSIERYDPRLNSIVPEGSRMEQIAEGFEWCEGPVWAPRLKALLFSDTQRNVVFQWKEGAGVSEFLKPSGYTGTKPRGGEPGSNGLMLDLEGNLVLCQHGDRRLARLEGDGGSRKFVTLADRWEGKRFSSPNDGVFKSNGDLYFTDPPYGLLKLNDDPDKEIPHNGVYRIAKDGTVTLLTKELTLPNGIAFSPDEKTLYVGNSDPKLAIWKAYPVKEDGTLDVGASRVFANVTDRVGKAKGLPDGMKVDRDGNIFATGPGGVFVFAPDGKLLGLLNTGQATGNCAWGDDGSTLYICADMYIARIKLKTKGNGF